MQVKAAAPPAMRPGSLGAVCAITEIENDAQAKEYGVAVGSIVYLIEFGDGSSIEIPGVWLEPEGP